MLSKKMKPLSLFFFLLVPRSVSFGLCHDIISSVCWMSRDGAPDGQEENIWLNKVALKSIRLAGKVTSLTLYPAVEHKLTLQDGGSVHTWTITVSPRTKSIKIRGRQKPLTHPTNDTKDFLSLLDPAEVFACESNTLFFHQDEKLLLATGHTTRLPVELSSRSTSMLLFSWMGLRADVAYSHTVSLYHAELGSYNLLSTDSTTRSHYRFTALDSCSPYVACVAIAGAHSLTCLSTITDPDIPQDFEVTSWNISSISLTWNCPANRKYGLFLLTVFYLSGTDHVIAEESSWHRGGSFAFTLSDLQPCSRVKLGLQTVCLAGLESRYSKMVLNDGNSVHSDIQALHQISFGPDNYTLRWEVRNTSSISMFRVYHDGVLRGTTLVTNYTVGGLLPCQEHQAKVEALCGESVLMSSRVVPVHTGPRGVSELRFLSNSSTALWLPGTAQPSPLAFLYELSLGNGSSVQSSRLTDAELHLPGLEGGRTYVLDVWEQCEGRWESQRSSVVIQGAGPLQQASVRAAQGRPSVRHSNASPPPAPDGCASPRGSVCPASSLCVATLGSYACVCRRGDYDVSAVAELAPAARPLCKGKGLFGRCAHGLMTGGIAEPYLTAHAGGAVAVTLNDGRCSVDKRDNIYFFRASQKSSACGTERRVNETHIVFQNTLSARLSDGRPISRRDLTVVWQCVFARRHVRQAQVRVDNERLASLSLVGSDPSPPLGLAMTLFGDAAYAQQFPDVARLGQGDTLFLQVGLQTNGSFAADVLLRVESCWATESTDPQDAVRGVFLQDGCPVDNTFQWLSVNGLSQSSRFSIHMFTMPKGLPLYIHCITNICGRDEKCTKSCTGEQRVQRSVSLGKRAAVVSAGPLVVGASVKSGDPVHSASWTEHMSMILTVVVLIGILGVTVLSVSATKAIMNYYEQLRQQ